MAWGDNFNGFALDKTALSTNDYLVLVGLRSDFSLTTTTHGEVTASSVLDTNLHQFGYVDQDTIKVAIKGDKKGKAGVGNQEVNISHMQEVEFQIHQSASLDAKTVQELEDYELVVVVCDQDAVTVTTANLDTNSTITAGNCKYIFDHCFLQIDVEDNGGEQKVGTAKMVKTNLPVKYAYMGEGIAQTLTT